MNFENKISELKEISEKLENPDISLDESVALYEKGISIAHDCYEELNNVKGKITVLKKELDTYKEENFEY